MLSRPIVRDVLGRQPVEQFGVGWRLATNPEIVHGADDPFPEKMLPHMVHGDAGGQGIVVVD